VRVSGGGGVECETAGWAQRTMTASGGNRRADGRVGRSVRCREERPEGLGNGRDSRSGRTLASNSSGVRRPSETVASLRVVPSLWAFLAHLATSKRGSNGQSPAHEQGAKRQNKKEGTDCRSRGAS
jgi:hypothetical protein